MNLVDIEVKKRKELEKKERRARRLRLGKLRVTGLLFTLVLVALTGRIYFIKMVHGDEFERRALAQQFNRHNSESVIHPNRGNIVDRNNQTLAISHTAYNVILDIRMLARESPETQTHTVNTLHDILRIPEYELRNFLAIDLSTGRPVIDRHYFRIAENISRATRNEIIDSEAKGVYFTMTTLRDYPHGNLASQIIGFIRGDSSWGLELQYDLEMSGREGRTVRFYDSRGNPVTEQMEPVDGYTLVTTLDTEIQRICEIAALSMGREFEAQNALVAVMDPNTGELLGMAQYPTFDLNDPANMSLFTNSRNLVDLLGNPIAQDGDDDFVNRFRVWTNYGVSVTFEPGSIYKTMVVAAAIEENVISRHDRFFCGGGKQVLDRYIPCWIAEYGVTHGSQSITEVLANSCNVGMMDIVMSLERDRFYNKQRDFGFGGVTGIDLPGETSAANLLYSRAGLNPVELATGSIGQGFNVTAIQAMSAFAATINGGYLMRPFVVSQVLNARGVVVSENRPTVTRKVVSHETSRFMREAMREVFTLE
ncbi:MAG: penicillin-binding transpeptidase domain-containing protein, partial [Defluviitaleaceae bacterium]|nr:penicillin-binding transpeptidase domain-containing protein [Defluviitaleaceae bacterium]